MNSLFIAVDLGAGSGRVFIAGVMPGEMLLEEIHRFQYPPSERSGHLRWDLSLIYGNIRTGLKKAADKARELGRPVLSIGVDSWAVDYGLLNSAGDLIADPICYRDGRTTGIMDRVFAHIPGSEIFERTGIQFLNFNTLFQLFAEDEDLSRVSKLLLLPDLINYLLTGRSAAEYTNATTTQMVNACTGDWDRELLARLGLRSEILADIIPAGTDIGELRPEIALETGLNSVRVIAPATHDTASAVAGAPLAANEAYISSGTWSLIGIERSEPLINADVAKHNFTNEGGVYGTFRFLKNVMGLWIFESCRKEWRTGGRVLDYEAVISGVSSRAGGGGLIFPDDPRFLNPPSMVAAIAEQMTETGQTFDPDPIAVSKVIFDSLAFRYASVLRTIESLTGDPIDAIQVVGGGGKNRYLNQITADASGRPLRSGLTEATVVGNILVQAIAAGRFASLAEARGHVSGNVTFEHFEPQRSIELTDTAARYSAIEAGFLK